jgi:SAM-dependent methyltransferase
VKGDTEKILPQAPTGAQTMSSALPEAENYHRYVYRKLRPYLGRRVWEIGAGHGQYTTMLLANDREVLATDVDAEMLRGLESRQRSSNARVSVARVDLLDESTVTACASWRPDSVLCLNVLEHIPEDRQCVRWLFVHLGRGCRAVFLVPAHPALYGFMDSQAGHVQRYTRTTLANTFERSGWTVQRSFYMNPVGGVGWFVRNRLFVPSAADLNSPRVNDDIRFFDRYLVGVTQALDPLFARVFGQSVVVIAEKL